MKKKGIFKFNLVLVVCLCLTMGVMFSACGSDKSSDKSESKVEDNVSDDTDDDADDTDDGADDAADDQAFSPTGTWVLSSIIDADQNDYTLEEYCEAQGVDSAGVEATYTFSDDETVVGDIGGISTEGTYSVSDNVVTLTFNGNSNSMEYDSDSETMIATDANSGVSSIFTQQ